MTKTIAGFIAFAVVCFCVLGCTSKTELEPLINPVVEIEGKPHQKIYITYDGIQGMVVKGKFAGHSYNDPGPRELDDQGKLTIKFDTTGQRDWEKVTVGLNVRMVNLSSDPLKAVAKADNCPEAKAEISERLGCIQLTLGYQFEPSDDFFYRSPESLVDGAIKEARSFE